MSLLMKRALALLAVSVAIVLPAQAQFSPITQPNAGYVSGTTLLNFAAPDFDVLSSLGDATLTVGFVGDLTALTVPTTWGSWGAPPNTETSTPRVLWTNGLTDLSFHLSKAVGIFGFEAQPNTETISTLIVTFFNGPTQVGQISRNVDGSGGARLFAAQTTGQFTGVTISSTDDFAVARLRYSSVFTAPEPAALSLLILVGIPAAGVYRCRRK